MTANRKEMLLREATEGSRELRQGLVTLITPAHISPTAKVPFKLRVLRELLLHRFSDLSDAACLLYNRGSTVPAFVLTRAAFETMATLFYLNKNVEAAVHAGDVEALDSAAMKGTFGTKDKSTPFEAVNVLTVITHLEKAYPGLQQDFELLCEFAHPNCAGVMVAYEAVQAVNIDNPHVPLALGADACGLNPEFGLSCLCIAITMTDWFARELARKDDDIIRLCEGELQTGSTSSPIAQ